MSWQTIKVRFEDPVCYVQFYRPDANNTINALLIEECHQVLDLCEEKSTVVVFEGLPEVFCFGADFKGISVQAASGVTTAEDPERTYALWQRMATGPYVTVAHVRGKANAGGMGFVASCDIVLADETALFSLSELLWGLFPACVLPFLVRKIGFQKAHYLALMTKPVTVQQALTWGIVDAYHASSESLLRQHLTRLKTLTKEGLRRYKRYMGELSGGISTFKDAAITANKTIFSDPHNLDKIVRFVETGKYPWES